MFANPALEIRSEGTSERLRAELPSGSPWPISPPQRPSGPQILAQAWGWPCIQQT